MKKSLTLVLVVVSILIFSQTFKLEKVLGFSDISSLAFKDGYLLLGTGNGEIIVYKDGSYYRAFKVHDNRVNEVIFENGFIVSASDDKTVGVTNLETGETHLLKGHIKGVSSVAVAGSKILSASFDGTVRVWSFPDGGEISSQKLGPSVVQIAAHENRYVVGLANGLALIRDLSNQSFSIPLKAHPEGIKKIVFSENGQLIATCGGNTVKVWNASNGNLVLQYDHVITVNDVAFLENDSLIFVADDYKAVVLNIQKNEVVKSIDAHNNFVLFVSSDDGSIATYGMDKTVKVWNANLELQYSLYGHQLSVNTVALSSDRKFIVSGSDDREILIWNTEKGIAEHRIKALSGVRKLLTVENNIISCLDSNQLKIYNLENGKLVKRIKVGTTSTMDIALQNDRMAVGFYDGSVALFRYPSFEEIWRKDTEHEMIQTIDMNNKFIAFGVSYSDPKDKIGYVEVLSADTGERVFLLEGHRGNVNAVKFAGDFLVSGGEDGKVILWSLDTGSKVREIYLNEPVSSLFVDEKELFVGTWNGSIKIFAFPDLTLKTSLKASDQKIGHLIKVGNHLVVPCGDGKIRILVEK
ncbi:MAG TPA: WD40 repeat domain-containing protein [Thermotoga naphthophila]|nr:WD40 repeat domain-containing protein [Thermotoga petrophila]